MSNHQSSVNVNERNSKGQGMRQHTDSFKGNKPQNFGIRKNSNNIAAIIGSGSTTTEKPSYN